MNKPIYDFFTNDHRRIDQLLEDSIENKKVTNFDLYHQFRVGLLTHIKMEEKILFKAAQEANGGQPVPIAAQLRLEHGALTALMTVYPDEKVINAVRHILEVHDEREEKPGGMYDICEQLTEHRTEEILEELANVTEVPVHPFNTSDMVFGAMTRALLRAGFDFDVISK